MIDSKSHISDFANLTPAKVVNTLNLDTRSHKYKESRACQTSLTCLLEGEDGVIIIDTMESPATAREVLAQFRRLTSKPVVAIILTHFHFDHVNGLEVFLEDARSKQI